MGERVKDFFEGGKISSPTAKCGHWTKGLCDVGLDPRAGEDKRGAGIQPALRSGDHILGPIARKKPEAPTI